MNDLWQTCIETLGFEQNPALLAALIVLAALMIALIAVTAMSILRTRRLRREMDDLHSRLEETDEHSQTAFQISRSEVKTSLEDFKGDLVRVMGDLARLQKEQSGELDKRLRSQESGAQAQADRLLKLDEGLRRRLDESDRRLETLCRKINLPAKSDGADYLAQGLRLITEQLKAMSAQLESLEHSQTRPRETPIRAEGELVVPAPQPEENSDLPEPLPEQPEETARYESTSWD